jgi:hypothetical protein
MTVLWVVLGLVAIVLAMAITGIVFGRGHLGAEQTPNHYLDEAGVNAPVPGGYVSRRSYD